MTFNRAFNEADAPIPVTAGLWLASQLDFAPLCGVAGEVSHAVIELSRDFDDVAAERGR